MYYTKSKPMTEQEAIISIKNNLQYLIPNIKIANISSGIPSSKFNRAGIVAEVKFGKLRKELVIGVKANGEPKTVERSIYMLKKITLRNKSQYPVFAAPYISERSRELLTSENIGYIDLIGDIYIRFGSVFIDRTGKAMHKAEQRLNRGIFAPKATRILRTVINMPDKLWTITELSKVCKMSPAGVYFVINELAEKGYLSREANKTIKVLDIVKLLNDWAKNWTVKKSSSVGYFSFARSTEEIILGINSAAKDLNLKYALTGMAGASLVSPFVRYNDVWVYLDGDKDELVKKLDLREVTTGANLRIFKPYDTGVFMDSRQISGISIVSNIQLYIDLFSYPARGQEQAERLLNKNILG